MMVKAIFYGILSEWVGEKEVEFELPEGATYGKLLGEIGLRFGNKMPEILWDRLKNDFSAPVLALSSNGRINSEESLLGENEEVTFMLKVGGG
jgi:molybdopterin converting factor small subunit